MGDVSHESYVEVRTELQNAAMGAAIEVRPNDGEYQVRVLYHVLTRFRPERLGPGGIPAYTRECAEGIHRREVSLGAAKPAGQLKIPCAVCGGIFHAVLPRGGDGSRFTPRVHGPHVSRCPGSYQEVEP